MLSLMVFRWTPSPRVRRRMNGYAGFGGSDDYHGDSYRYRRHPSECSSCHPPYCIRLLERVCPTLLKIFHSCYNDKSLFGGSIKIDSVALFNIARKLLAQIKSSHIYFARPLLLISPPKKLFCNFSL